MYTNSVTRWKPIPRLLFLFAQKYQLPGSAICDSLNLLTLRKSRSLNYTNAFGRTFSSWGSVIRLTVLSCVLAPLPLHSNPFTAVHVHLRETLQQIVMYPPWINIWLSLPGPYSMFIMHAIVLLPFANVLRCFQVLIFAKGKHNQRSAHQDIYHRGSWEGVSGKITHSLTARSRFIDYMKIPQRGWA